MKPILSLAHTVLFGIKLGHFIEESIFSNVNNTLALERESENKEEKTCLVGLTPGADAIKKFTPTLGIPYLGV